MSLVFLVLVYRHDLLEDFMKMIGVNEDTIYQDVEGIEHHLSWDAIDRIGDLVQYFQEDEKRLYDLIRRIPSNGRRRSTCMENSQEPL